MLLRETAKRQGLSDDNYDEKLRRKEERFTIDWEIN